jgi:hypothetical protein
MGWMVTNSPTLTDGAWNRDFPLGGGDRGDPPTDADGSGRLYLTDSADGNSDVDGGSTTLTSPIMDATGGDATLSYYRWYSNTFGADPMNDIFTVEISNNNGGTWQVLEIVGPSGPEVSGGWFFKTWDIASVITPTNEMKVRFTAEDAGPGSVIEAGVDGVKIEVFNCENPEPTCPLDWDGNGIINSTDVSLFLNDWFADQINGTLLADYNGNLESNSTDVSDFLNDYFNRPKGCPQ